MSALRRGGTLFENVPALGALSASGVGRAKLIPVAVDHPGLELVEGISRIGRDQAQNDLVVISDQVSRRHCEITMQDGEIWIKDLGSSNGTFINRKKVTEPTRVSPGDEVGISPQLSFRLVMDQEMQRPGEMEVPFEDARTEMQSIPPGSEAALGLEHAGPASAPAPADLAPSAAPSPGPAAMVAVAASEPPQPGPVQRAMTGPPPLPADAVRGKLPLQPKISEPGTPSAEGDAGVLLAQVEKQRNVLAILYQISLRCLMSGEDHKEIEQLLTNVLQRLAPLDSGFIIYRKGGSYRASIVPSAVRPDQNTVRAASKVGLELQEARVLSTPAELGPLALSGGSAMLVPMMGDEGTVGLICCISSNSEAYDEDVLDIVAQIGNVAAAALVR